MHMSVFHLPSLSLCGVCVCVCVCVCTPYSIFGHDGETADDVAYVNWLSMVRAGLLGLEFYSPETNKWRQVLHLPTLQSMHSGSSFAVFVQHATLKFQV